MSRIFFQALLPPIFLAIMLLQSIRHVVQVGTAAIATFPGRRNMARAVNCVVIDTIFILRSHTNAQFWHFYWSHS